MSKKLTIEHARQIAEAKGGECLSDTYINNQTNLNWRCAKGHIWKATYNSVKGRTWCPECSGIWPLTIAQMQEIAQKRGGNCLSTEYKNARTKLQWRCAQGHEWEATPTGIRNAGTWCPYCAGHKSKSIDELQAVAKSKGGRLLSSKYININTKYLWECSEKHQWWASASSVSRISWCPECSGHIGERLTRAIFESIFAKPFPSTWPKWLRNDNGYVMQLDGYCEELGIAFEHHGEHHYSQVAMFQKDTKKFQYQQDKDLQKLRLCKQNNVILIEVPHYFQPEEVVQLIRNTCSENSIKFPSGWRLSQVDYSKAFVRKKLEGLQELALRHDGECLAEVYKGMRKKVKWRCSEGHEWEAAPETVQAGYWCLICAGFIPVTIEQATNIASKFDGVCLSSSLENNRSYLRWKCREGHIFRAKYANVQQGYWCPDCGGSKSKTLEDAKLLGKQNGGQCLSTEYVNAKTNLKWQCGRGHQWKATYNNIQRGKWCLTCRHRIPSIEDMKSIAKEREGKCLSSAYKDMKTHLEWECKKGHIWSAQPRHIKKGGWCPTCAVKKRRYSIDDMQVLAVSRGGKCLSTRYADIYSTLTWECSEGHIWDMPPVYIKHRKRWCPNCAKEKRRLRIHIKE